MNRKLILAKYIAKVTFKSIWLVFAIPIFCIAAGSIKEISGFGEWMILGFLCSIPLFVDLIKEMISGGKKGAIEGANTYYVRDWGSTISISNAPGLGAIQGFIISGFVFVALGVFWLGIKFMPD